MLARTGLCTIFVHLNVRATITLAGYPEMSPGQKQDAKPEAKQIKVIAWSAPT